MKRFILTKNENLDVEVEETYIEFDEEKEYENNNKELKNLENKKADYEEKYRKNKELSKEERLDYIKTLWEIDTIQKSIFSYENKI
jgi:hypothetical protein